MGLVDLFRRRSTDGPTTMHARLEGAMAKRRLRGWNPPLENINALVASGGPRLLARSRELVVSNGYAANACEAFAANLVGDGIKPSSLIADARVRDAVQRLWLAWTDEADADGLTDFYGLQAMVAREMFVAGECFLRLRSRRPEDGLLVPLQLQLLQAEMLPFEKTETAANGNRIRCGIEFDAIGRRIAYHFRRRHPGDSTDQSGPAIPETVRVPAADVLHITMSPVVLRDAEPNAILEVRIIDVKPRPCANSDFAGKACGSNAAVSWGLQCHPVQRLLRRRKA